MILIRARPVGASLSEKAMIDLWYKMSSSIRLRPTESRKVTAAASSVASLGTIATAGETCPFTGYWQCNEGGDGVTVLGGQRQYLRKGQRMPQALLLPPQTLWEKLRGVQSSFESKTKTLWRMVDRRSRE